MFNNVITSLASLLPKYFIFGSYVPSLIFFFINSVLLYGNVAAARTFVATLQPGGWALATTIAFVGSIVFAYALSSVSAFLRDLLEGKHLPALLVHPMVDRQADRCKKLEDESETARDSAADVREAKGGWDKAMENAAAEGRAKHGGQTGYDPSKDPAGRKLRSVRQSMSTVTHAELQQLVELFCEALKKYDFKADIQLKGDYTQLENAFDEAGKALDAKETDSFIERHMRFGLGAPAPTMMGNIAAALQGYAFSRYGFDLDALWSRLLVVLQRADEKAYGSLLDAKTQLDFLVACFWLTVATTAFWLIALAAVSSSPVTFIVIAIGGPLTAASYHSLAVTNYRSYGEVVRATVDLYRFALLRELHIPLPSGLRDERVLWSALRGVSSFGDPVELSYEHPPT